MNGQKDPLGGARTTGRCYLTGAMLGLTESMMQGLRIRVDDKKGCQANMMMTAECKARSPKKVEIDDRG